jgi:hypothetical protein
VQVAQEYLGHKMIWILVSISIMALALFYFYYSYISKKQLIKLKENYNNGKTKDTNTRDIQTDKTGSCGPIKREPSIEGDEQPKTGFLLPSAKNIVVVKNSGELTDDSGKKE